jgi:tetratricopeptide (TPR) repeat protein
MPTDGTNTDLEAIKASAARAFQGGDAKLALEWIERAAAIEPADALLQVSRGMALQALGRIEEAAASFDRAIAARPEFVEARCHRAVASNLLGRFSEAVDQCDRAIALQPDHAEAHFHRAVALKAMRQWDAALAAFDRALRAQPGHAEASFHRGLLQHERGRLQEAIAGYEGAIAAQPGHGAAHAYRGLALHALGQDEAALASYDRALALRGDDLMVLFNRGALLQKLQRPEAALQSYDRALAIEPSHAESHYNRGILLEQAQRLEEALASFDRALGLMAHSADLHCSRGAVQQRLGRLPEALESFERTLALRADHPLALANRGIVLQELGRLEEAVASYARALERAPDDTQCHYNRALAWLAMGDYARGWQEHEWRWEHKPLEISRKPLRAPLWLGQWPLEGRTILLHSEQGLGDAIQFCRFARFVKDLGASVILEVRPPLAGLLGDLDGIDDLVTDGDPMPVIDCHCPLLSLPLALKTGLNDIPAAQGYLRADADRTATWEKRLGPRIRPRVGLVWSGSTGHKNDRYRSMPLAELLEALPEGIEYVGLQKEVRESDREALRLRPDLRNWGGQLEDFRDTAALCCSLDLLISVDTSVVHLAGGLGVAARVLLPFNADWRWLRGRDDSPWYCSLRLYRQSSLGSWRRPLELVRAELNELARKV